MSVDIERTVIYDETFPACEEIALPKSRTIVTAGDDGFIEIENQICPLVSEEGTAEGKIERCYLTPTMLRAIVAWVFLNGSNKS